MDASDFDVAGRLFLQAIDLDPAQREELLDRECAGNPGLRAEVEALLERDRQSHALLDSGTTEHRGLPRLKDLETSRKAIGPYLVLETLGEGGMGVVYLAQQQTPIQRRVALKVVKWGMDTKQVVARFEAERQALAIMDHPNIARVFDAGATEQGRPYFAMELVRGEPITTYCDKNRLSMGERLELFLQVCEGVQHAHQKGIIHRDIKPSNVLVTVQGERAVPKIIDFGVARATEQRLTERTVYTEMGQLIGTPEYMSPEQAEMTGVDIDTRTDVYSLGVLLYELLVGALPFDPSSLRKAGFDEIRRNIREVEPSRPSTRISTLGDDVSKESARLRRTDRASLRRQLSGDLDWITMKTLEKDRVRRYGSPSDLAEDIRRHLRHDAVLAGPPSALYRTSKFVRRHRFGVGAAAGFLLLMLGFLVVTMVQSGRIARERDRAVHAELEARNEAEAAQQVSEFLVGLFEVSDPSQTRGEKITARELLDRGAKKIEGDLEDQPGVQTRLMRTIGEVYRRLGLFDRSERLLRESLTTSERELGKDHPDTLGAANNLATLYLDLGRYDEAEQLFTDAAEVSRRVLGPDHPETLRIMHNLAWQYHKQGRLDEAESLYTTVLERRRVVLGDDDPDTLWSMHSLGWIRHTQGRLSEAVPLYTEVLDHRRRHLGDDHPDTLWSIYALASVYHSLNRLEEAESLHSEALELRRRVMGADHPDTLWSLHDLTVLYQSVGRMDEAEAMGLEVLNARRRLLGETHPETLWSKNILGTIYSAQHRFGEAELLLTQAVEGREAVLGRDNRQTLTAMIDLAEIYVQQRRFDDAEAVYEATLESARRALGDERPLTLECQSGLAVMLRKQGRYSEAETTNLETIRALERTVGGDDLTTIRAKYNMAILYMYQQRYEEADALYFEVLRSYEHAVGEDHPIRWHVMNNVGELYAMMGRYDEALEMLQRVLDARIRAGEDDGVETASTYFNLGGLAAVQGKRKEALSYLRKAAERGERAYRFKESVLLEPLRGNAKFKAIVAELEGREG